MAFFQVDDVRAATRYEEALALFRGLGDRRGVAAALDNLGNVAQERAEPARAAALLGESLALFDEIGDPTGVANTLEALATTAGAWLDPARTARLFAAADALREAIETPVPMNKRVEHERDVADVRARLGEAGFAAAWAVGRALRWERAIAEGRALAAAHAAAPGPIPPRRPAAPHGLTGREVEILRLLATGDSNRETGNRLYLSPATVARHLANFYAKLGVHCAG